MYEASANRERDDEARVYTIVEWILERCSAPPEGRHDSIRSLVPDETVRERLRSNIDQAIRDRLEQAARGEESLIRVREPSTVNLITRVFDGLS